MAVHKSMIAYSSKCKLLLLVDITHLKNSGHIDRHPIGSTTSALEFFYPDVQKQIRAHTPEVALRQPNESWYLRNERQQ